MKKLLDLVKNKYFLTTLILLGGYIFFAFVSTTWDEAAYTGFSLSSWVMFLVNAGLVALIVFGLFTKKKEFVSIPFMILGFASIYSLISNIGSISSFFHDLFNIGSSIRAAKNYGMTPKVNVPTIFAYLASGLIGLAALGGFVLLILGKVVLKKDKLVKIGGIIISTISVGYVAFGLFALISSICDAVWSNMNNIYYCNASYSGSSFVSSLSRASLWMILALVNLLGLPEKVAKSGSANNEEAVEKETSETVTAEEEVSID